MNTKLGKIFITIVVISIAFCLVFILTGRVHTASKKADNTYLSLLQEAFSMVSKKYVDAADNGKIVQSMIDGMLAALDPHSAYLPPEPYHEMEIQMSGAFGGVGIELGMREKRLTVIAPIDDTPAFRAGIQANDHIVKIDNKITQDMSIAAAVKIMRGEKGIPVVLTIMRADSHQPLVFRLVRDIIKIKSLKYRLLEGGYGFIRIGQFQQKTGEEFRDALQKLTAESGGSLQGLVIDLRYNPGGLLNSSIDVVNAFIGDDIQKSLIVSTKGREASANREFHATLGHKEPHYPLVVLINGGSASASEIVAGALQDHKRAIIMGKQSFGKGSVQSIIPLKGNAALKLTTALYYTPSGRSIQAKGIEPDIVVDTVAPLAIATKQEPEFSEKTLENHLTPNLKEASEKLKEPNLSTPSVNQHKESPPNAITIGDVEKDYQLKRALELMRSLQLVKGKIGRVQ